RARDCGRLPAAAGDELARKSVLPQLGCAPRLRNDIDGSRDADRCARGFSENYMAQITGAELVLKCLAVEGIKFFFGIPCPEVDPMLAKLDDYGMRFVPVRHEAAAVHMAEGLYKT